jgi:hypothetical protein
MPAPKGNQFWKARSKHGKDKIWNNPEVLWDACEEYFQWVEDNPLWSSKTVQYQGVPIDLPEAKMRAMTITGLCRFLHINHDTWSNYRKNKDYVGVIMRAEDVIRDQKFSGAAADLLNPNIIARDLGLVDKQEQKHIKSLEDCDDDELDRIIRERQQALDKAKQD